VRAVPVPVADGSPDRFVYDAVDQLRHDLKTPLTTISARAYLLARSVRRSPSLTAEERARLLAGVVAIEEAVRAMVITIDGLGDKGADAPERDAGDAACGPARNAKCPGAS
jgi:signal transduction histidine kinase